MRLPLFPLHVVLFPGASLPLHIFETRYKAMMETVLASPERAFGVLAIRSGMESGGPADVFDTGTIARVEQVQRSSDGTMGIVVQGTQRFRLDERLPDDPFPIGDVTPLAEQTGESPGDHLTAARAALHRYLSVVAKLQGSDVIAPAVPLDIVEASFTLAIALHVDLADRQRLLEVPDAAARLKMLTELARREARLLEAVGPSAGNPGTQFSLN